MDDMLVTQQAQLKIAQLTDQFRESTAIIAEELRKRDGFDRVESKHIDEAVKILAPGLKRRRGFWSSWF